MWTIAASVSATLVSVAILVGFAIRFGLVPFLEKKLIGPILTQLGQVVQITNDVKEIANDASKEVKVIVKAWDHHLNWSQDEVDAIWRELRRGERVVKQRSRGD